MLAARLAQPSPAALKLRARVIFDASGTDRYTVDFNDGVIEMQQGAIGRATTLIESDAATFIEIFKGKRSGVDAFLDGDVRVRGNLALALKLDSLFEGVTLPVTFPRPDSVRAGGLKTSFLEAGEGPPMILLHGLGATNASMLPTVAAFSATHRVIAPDLPGFGESDKPVRSYNAYFFARWLKDFMRELDIEQADLVGNSMGGRIAIEAGLGSPEMIRSLSLLCPAPAFLRGRQYVPFVRLLRPELALVPAIPMTHRYLVNNLKTMFSKPERLPDAWYDAAADEFLRVFRTSRGRIALFSAARQIYLEEPHGTKGFWDRLPRLTVPSLFIWGKRDPLVPYRFARHVARALPNATTLVLDDCGHIPQFELPGPTHSAIRDFISQDL